MDQLQTLTDGFIDFDGQKLAENILTFLLALSGVIAWCAGFLLQDIRYTLWIGLVGTALTFLAVVPPWPFYNKHPQTWLPAGTEDVERKEK